MQYIALDVVLPEGIVWEFMREFGEKFAHLDHEFGTKLNRAVDRYRPGAAGWYVRVSTNIERKEELLNFVRNFAESRGVELTTA